MSSGEASGPVVRLGRRVLALELGVGALELLVVGTPFRLLARSASVEGGLDRALLPLFVGLWMVAAWRLWDELEPVRRLVRAKQAAEAISSEEVEAARRAFARAPVVSGAFHAAAWAIVAAMALAIGVQRGRALPPLPAAGLLGATLLHAAALGALRTLLCDRTLSRLRPALLPNVEPIRFFARGYRRHLALLGLAALGGAHAFLALLVAAFTTFDAAALSALGLSAWPILLPAAFFWSRSLWRRTAAVERYFAGTLRSTGTRGPARDDPRAVTAFQAAQALPYRLALNHAFSVALAAVLAAALGRRGFAFSAAATSRLVAAAAIVTAADFLYVLLFVRLALLPLMRHLGSRHHLPAAAIRSRIGLRVKLYGFALGIVAISAGLVALYLKAAARDPLLGPASLLLGSALVVGLTLAVVRELVAPIQGLESRSEEMSRGELARPVAPPGEADEVGRLAIAFEEMRRALRDRLRSTESINIDLEREVRRRTEALEQRNAELREALEKLRRAQDNLVRSEKLASMGRLVAGIAHEINNPVNAVINSIGPLEETLGEIARATGPGEAGAFAKSAEEMLAVVKRGAGRTKAIVQALHNYSRGDESAQREVVLARSVEDSVDLLRHRLRGIELIKEVDPDAKILGFPGQVDQVLMNLVTNAAQAIGARGGTIHITAATRGDRVELSVSDDGPGIPADLLPRIFDPFFTTKDVGEGSGLGLSIVHGIVERHGGKIDVESALGQGTTFRVSFPVAAGRRAHVS